MLYAIAIEEIKRYWRNDHLERGGEGGSGDDKRGHRLSRTVTKKVVSFLAKKYGESKVKYFLYLGLTNANHDINMHTNTMYNELSRRTATTRYQV